MSHSELSAAANKAFSDAADKVEHLLVWAQQLQPADQQHLDIMMEMGQALTAVCTKYSEELTEHLDDNGTGLISSPVWSNIWVDDPRIKGHPLFTSTLQYQQPVLPPSPTTAGPSKQCQKSKAIITSDDDHELDEPKPTIMVQSKEQLFNMVYKLGQLTKAVAKPNAHCVQCQSVIVTSDYELDANEPVKVGPPPKMGLPYVAFQPIPKTAQGSSLKEDDFANTDAPTWIPHCGQCVARDLVCHQAFNKDHGGKLKVCSLYSRLKIKCSGQGSEAPKAKGKPIATCQGHSQSCQHPMLSEVVENNEHVATADEGGPVLSSLLSNPTTAINTSNVVRKWLPSIWQLQPYKTGWPLGNSSFRIPPTDWLLPAILQPSESSVSDSGHSAIVPPQNESALTSSGGLESQPPSTESPVETGTQPAIGSLTDPSLELLTSLAGPAKTLEDSAQSLVMPIVSLPVEPLDSVHSPVKSTASLPVEESAM
ncbi:hypothetical protein F4604DRAFT_1688186 [Suillus subluteus]|nr:hypothetical protein F4604DRAFT_1688186 [Suillus subluteus]